ncbi:hypothetical protein GCM10010339_35960 [Streptomyces alanosinicus]|uniref:Uncharacterized protein n=1 Tax=Streptomyces alanosinicus TaxID=68171 RepID=A0A919D1Y4_9ACTN|nr:hypothetical protein GCM10010339_35960 [Streptomyces alanosinicus]
MRAGTGASRVWPSRSWRVTRASAGGNGRPPGEVAHTLAPRRAVDLAGVAFAEEWAAAAIRPFSQVTMGHSGMPPTRDSCAHDGAFTPVRPRCSGWLRTSL